jgi:hypothetical protein
VRRIENRFCWSKSRADTFRYCLRKYWWSYYGSWNGWEPDAAPRARDAWLLKGLHSRWSWAGQVVHTFIERMLKHYSLGGPERGALGLGTAVPDVAEEVEALTQTMRSQFRESRDGRYRADPRRYVGLVEHEYGDPVTGDEWREIHRRAVDCVGRFLASPVFERIRSSDPSTWIGVEHLDSFELEGVPVWVALDFGMRSPTGADVYDWKTGEERPEADRLQMLCYALYLEARAGVPRGAVTCHVVNVRTGAQVEWTPTTSELDEARGEMLRSVSEMRRRVRDLGENAADMLAFPMTEDATKCVTCSFRRLCER